MSGAKAWALTADGDEVQTCHPSCRDKISGILDHVGLSLFPLSPFDASFAIDYNLLNYLVHLGTLPLGLPRILCFECYSGSFGYVSS